MARELSPEKALFPLSISYKTKPKDSLIGVAEHFYKNKDKWTLLLESNIETLGEKFKFQEGSVLKIPLDLSSGARFEPLIREYEREK